MPCSVGPFVVPPLGGPKVVIPFKASLHLMKKPRTKTSLLKFATVKIVSKSLFSCVVPFGDASWQGNFIKSGNKACKNCIKLNASFFLFLRMRLS